MVARLRNPFEVLDHGWPPLSEKFQHKLKEDQRRRAEQRRQKEDAESTAIELQSRREHFEAETARLEQAWGVRLDSLSPEENQQLIHKKIRY
jgi:predicted nuclease with TOPRIM domain